MTKKHRKLIETRGREEEQKRTQQRVSDSELPDAPRSRAPMTSLATPSAVEEAVSGISAVEIRLSIPSNGFPKDGLRRLHLLQECAVFPQRGLHGECAWRAAGIAALARAN